MTPRLPIPIVITSPGLYDEDGGTPIYHSAGAAAFDCRAERDVVLYPNQSYVLGVGFKAAIPEGYEAQVRGRSGLAIKGVTISHGVGTIDSDYRGPWAAILMNHGTGPYEIKRGERVMQVVIAPVVLASLYVTNELPESARGENGFGSTGQ